MFLGPFLVGVAAVIVAFVLMVIVAVVVVVFVVVDDVHAYDVSLCFCLFLLRLLLMLLSLIIKYIVGFHFSAENDHCQNSQRAVGHCGSSNSNNYNNSNNSLTATTTATKTTLIKQVDNRHWSLHWISYGKFRLVFSILLLVNGNETL